MATSRDNLKKALLNKLTRKGGGIDITKKVNVSKNIPRGGPTVKMPTVRSSHPRRYVRRKGPRRVITTPPPAQWAEAGTTMGSGGSAAEAIMGGTGTLGAGREGGAVNILKKMLNYKATSKLGKVAEFALPAMIMMQLQGIGKAWQEGALQNKLGEVQMEGMTPEGLMAQAALPRQRAEEMALKQALVSRLSGGVLGPIGVPGETVIGG